MRHTSYALCSRATAQLVGETVLPFVFVTPGGSHPLDRIRSRTESKVAWSSAVTSSWIVAGAYVTFCWMYATPSRDAIVTRAELGTWIWTLVIGPRAPHGRAVKGAVRACPSTVNTLSAPTDSRTFASPGMSDV